MKTPNLEIDLRKIARNATQLQERFAQKGVEIVFITKGTCANLEIIKTVRECKIKYFGDSRIDNIKRVKQEIPELHYTLIRIPKLSELEEVVAYAQCSLHSELETIASLSQLALKHNKCHDIILMIDVGDLREGVLEEDALTTIEQILTKKGVNLIGIGTNVGCYGSVMPSVTNTEVLVKIKQQVQEQLNYKLRVISGGSTCTTDLLFKNLLNPEINLLRIGEAILFGEDSTNDKKIANLEGDAFIIGAEIIELKNKPSFPIGERGKDAFGQVIEYIDYGIINRAILAIGRQDVVIEALEPIDSTIKILGGSSDHMIVDLATSKYQLGDILRFRCAYSAVLQATTSPYVTTTIKNDSD